MPNTPLWLLQGFFHGSLFQGMNFISWEPSLENWCPLRSNLCPAESMEQGVSHSYWSPDLGWPPAARSVAKQNSWLKELEIKRRVAGHTACRHSLNETCQTSQGALARVCLWVTTEPSTESASWRTSGDFCQEVVLHRPRECNLPHACGKLSVDIPYGIGTQAFLQKLTLFFFFTIKKNTWSLSKMGISEKLERGKQKSPKSPTTQSYWWFYSGSSFFGYICICFSYS